MVGFEPLSRLITLGLLVRSIWIEIYAVDKYVTDYTCLFFLLPSRVLISRWSMPLWWPTLWRWSASSGWWPVWSASPPSVPPRSCRLTLRMPWSSGSTRWACWCPQLALFRIWLLVHRDIALYCTNTSWLGVKCQCTLDFLAALSIPLINV